MTNSDSGQQSPAETGVAEWHRIVAERDWDRLPGLLTDEVVFRGPANFEPHHGKAEMSAILPTVFGIMQDFEYLRHFKSPSGYVLEFRAHVGEENLYGADLIEFDESGKITDFMVMIRPASAAQALAAEAGRRLTLS